MTPGYCDLLSDSNADGGDASETTCAYKAPTPGDLDRRILAVVASASATDWIGLTRRLDGSREGYLAVGEAIEDAANKLLDACEAISECLRSPRL